MMQAVRRTSRRLKDTPAPQINQLEASVAEKPKPSRRKRALCENSLVETDAGDNSEKPAGRRQTAKRKQKQELETSEQNVEERELKRRRVTRKSSAVSYAEAEENVEEPEEALKNARPSRRAKTANAAVVEKPTPKPRAGKSKSAIKPQPAVEGKKEKTPAKKSDEVTSNGRVRRTVQKSNVVLMDFDPDEESETDFSDNDDDDFVLPQSEKSDDDDVPEGDPEPSDVLKPKPRQIARKESAVQETREDRIRRFLLEVDRGVPAVPKRISDAPLLSKTSELTKGPSESSQPIEKGSMAKKNSEKPSVSPKTTEKRSGPRRISEKTSLPSKATEALESEEKPLVPAKASARPTRNAAKSVTRPKSVSEKSGSDYEDESSSDSDDGKRKRARHTKGQARGAKKRSPSMSEASDDSLVVPKKAKSTRAPKVSAKNRKTFTKARKIAAGGRTEGETSPDGAAVDASLFEMSLLKLAKRMDRPSGDQGSEDGEEGGVDVKKGAEGDGAKKIGEGAEEDAVEPEPGIGADKKSLIMSMLKEHEPVDDMSDGSSDDEDEIKPAVKPGKNGKETAKTEDVNADPEVPEGTEAVGETETKSRKRKQNKKVAGKEAGKPTKESVGKKGAANKKKGVVKAEESSDSDEENWEVVENAAVRDPNYKRPDNVTVVLQAEDFISDGKKGLTMEQRMVRLINRRRRSAALYSHRVHLLTLICHHRWLNSIVESDFVKAIALSRLPVGLAMPARKRTEAQTLQHVLNHYEAKFQQLPSTEPFVPAKLKSNLMKLLVLQKTDCNITYILGLLTLLRVCGIRSRLCLSYRLTSHRAVQLRVNADGGMYEVGAKIRSQKAAAGIDDYFIEIYISGKKRWRPIDVENFEVIDDPQELTPHLEQPACHLIGIDGDGCMVDLSPKYNANWLDIVKTVRADSKFFEEVLARFAPAEADQLDEKEEVAIKHDQQGLPKKVTEYKNHPKYALERHLLKHEAFYPPNPPVVGVFRDEPVYPRKCVYLLHSKLQWHRKARTVKEGEEAYKIVTARPKFDRRKETWVKGLPLEIFGEWQTERYKPPVVLDGKIPRNAYGNVDLFHPDMLPIGAVHLKLPGLNRVATELGVDCVPACVGFDGLGRSFHAVLEGYCVCEEDAEKLEQAWYDRQSEDKHTRRARVRSRAIRNWKVMIKKVIWEMRLKKKYANNLEDERRAA